MRVPDCGGFYLMHAEESIPSLSCVDVGLRFTNPNPQGTKPTGAAGKPLFGGPLLTYEAMLAGITEIDEQPDHRPGKKQPDGLPTEAEK